MAGIEEKEKKRAAAGSNKKCEIAPRGRIESWWRAAHPWNEKERVSLSYNISITAIFSAAITKKGGKSDFVCEPQQTFFCVCCVYLIWLLFLLFFVFWFLLSSEPHPIIRPHDERITNERCNNRVFFLIVRHRLVSSSIFPRCCSLCYKMWTHGRPSVGPRRQLSPKSLLYKTIDSRW